MKSLLLKYVGWVVVSLFATSTLQAQNLNLAFGKPATATSVQNNNQAAYAARFATDGNNNTTWLSAAEGDQALTLDLGSVQSIDRVRISWNTEYARNLDLQVSDDGSVYTTVKSVTGNVPDQRDNLLINEYGQLGSHGRYLRLRCLAQATTHGFAVSELEVFTFSNVTPNLALARPAKATSSDLSLTNFLFQPSLAVDGNPQTRWSTLASSNQALVVDLGEVKQFTNIYLSWEQAYGVAFQLQVSSDSSTWATVATYTNNQARYNEVAVSTPGRYVRMLGQRGGQSGGGFSIYELAVYNSPALRAASAPVTISLYPNPTAGQATLEWEASAAGSARYTLFNSLGQVVRTDLLGAQAGHNSQALDLSALAAGSYLLALEANGQVLGRARVQKTD